MKKMIYGNVICEVAVVNNYSFTTEVACEYNKDTIGYAVERFFARCSSFCKTCTYESWQLRIAKGKARKNHKFTYLIPATLMELPGGWVRVSGEIDTVGVKVMKVELLKDHPCFVKKAKEQIAI